MKLELLDIDNYIKIHKLKQVTTIKLYEKIEKIDPNSLFSEQIFGKFGSVERRKTFAYVDLKIKVIHPEIYNIFTGINSDIAKLITNKEKYIVRNGELIQNNIKGSAGVNYFISIFNSIDFKKLKHVNPKNLSFILKNKEKVFIDKFLIIPAGIRDISVSKTTKQTLVNLSEISNLYTNLIRHTHTLGSNPTSIPEDIKILICDQIQKTLLEINSWLKSKLSGKTGLIRGGLLKKVVDYCGRLIITTDHTLPLGTVGIAWHVILKLFEPFAINMIMKKDMTMLSAIQYFLKSNNEISVEDLRKLFTTINNNPNIIPKEMLDYFINIAKEISKDKVVIYKRDPVNNRESWIAANIRIDGNGNDIKLNPLDLPRLDADHDGDQVAVVALFTKEAQEEAKLKMLPTQTKSNWFSAVSANKNNYQLTLDAMTAIYAATK